MPTVSIGSLRQPGAIHHAAATPNDAMQLTERRHQVGRLAAPYIIQHLLAWRGLSAAAELPRSARASCLPLRGSMPEPSRREFLNSVAAAAVAAAQVTPIEGHQMPPELKPLYRVRFGYPRGWNVRLGGKGAWKASTFTLLKASAQGGSRDGFGVRTTRYGAATAPCSQTSAGSSSARMVRSSTSIIRAMDAPIPSADDRSSFRPHMLATLTPAPQAMQSPASFGSARTIWPATAMGRPP